MTSAPLSGSATFIIGDVRDALATIPDGSVDLVLTSPPFLALRSYLPADHPDKHREIGAEPSPAEFVDTLLGLSAEWRRVLAPHGSIAVELGDTYSGSGGAGGDYADGGMREGQEAFSGSAKANRGGMGGRASMVDKATGGHHMGGPGWPLAKSLCLIPELYRIALVYGVNPLTGNQSPAGRWRARNVIRWCRPNPPVGALGDKVRPATSDMVVACVSPRRWFDLDAIRTEHKSDPANYTGNGYTKGQPEGVGATVPMAGNPAGAPPLDHWWHDDDTFDQDAWLVSTEAYRGSHYATWPRALLTKPIQSMCPLRVCRECGEPSRRIVETERTKDGKAIPDEDRAIRTNDMTGRTGNTGGNWRYATERCTLGWTDCGHNNWRPGVVLDPFAGSGTTLAVATNLGRDALGIDIDERNLGLAIERVGWNRLTAKSLDGTGIDLSSVPTPARPMTAREVMEREMLADPITFD